MNATIFPEKKKHYPVLLNEIISIITPQYGGTFIDCTFGQGGYTKKILEHKKNEVIAIDRDIKSENIASYLKKKFGNRFHFENKKFSSLDKLKINNKNIKSILFDLGYSYTQIKDINNGLSFNSSGNLNMKMGLNEFSANEVIHKLDKAELEKIFKFFGDEKDCKRIAKKIIEFRKSKKIKTEDLVNIIKKNKKVRNYKIHPATKIFQALRIFVNKEISELIYGLINATKVLEEGGIIIVVTFHSIEDRIVKYFFRSLSEEKGVSRYVPESIAKKKLLKQIFKKPITPSLKEMNENLPSRSAKLRYAVKNCEFYDFETDILEEFNYLLEIENYSKKL